MGLPVNRPFPRIFLAVFGLAAWAAPGFFLPLSSELVDHSWQSVANAFPLIVLTLIGVPAPANRWNFSNGRWSLIAAAVVLMVPMVSFIVGGPRTTGASVPAVIMTLAALWLYAVHEEIVFRLFLADVLSMGNRFMTGTVLSSALFALVHLDNPFSTPLSLVNIFLAGVGLCLIRAMGGGLAGAAAAHFLWNAGIGVLMGFEVSGYTFPAVFRTETVAETFGPESSPVLTVILAGMVIPAAIAWRGRSGSD